MFDDISGNYDLLNRIISLGMDGHWRKRTVKPHAANKFVLDICSGTGDMTKELLRLRGFEGFVVMGDFSAEMHKLAKIKFAGVANICLINCDAENMPFKPGVFDGVISGYSLRNLGDLKKFGSEISRVMSDNGAASIIDMAHPPNRVVAWLFHLYFYKFTPWFSRFFTKKKYAYKYLPVSLRTFLKQPEALKSLQGEMLKGKYENVAGGMVAIYRLHK